MAKLQSGTRIYGNLTVDTFINAATIGNVGATLTGTLSTAAQTNITSLGALTSLTSSGTIIAATVNAATIGNSGAVLTGTLSTVAQTNVTSVGTLTGGTWNASVIAGTYGGTGVNNGANTLTYSGNYTLNQSVNTASGPTFALGVTIPSIVHSGTTGIGDIGASGSTFASIYATTFIGALSGAATTAGTVTAAAQTNITSVGTLTGLTVSGTIAANANNTINIGAVGTTFATVYATTFSGVSTTAKYADLAENYIADRAYAPGTVLMFGGENEVTVASVDTTRIAGVVSTNPAHLMNSRLQGDTVVAVALQGRVPCKVSGPVEKGDMLVSAGSGYAKVNNSPAAGQVIGKSVGEYTDNAYAYNIVEIVVGRL